MDRRLLVFFLHRTQGVVWFGRLLEKPRSAWKCFGREDQCRRYGNEGKTRSVDRGGRGAQAVLNCNDISKVLVSAASSGRSSWRAGTACVRAFLSRMWSCRCWKCHPREIRQACTHIVSHQAPHQAPMTRVPCASASAKLFFQQHNRRVTFSVVHHFGGAPKTTDDA